MSFDPNARLDPGQVEDVRGSRIGGRGLAIGGGGLGTVVLLVVYLLLGGNLDSLVGGQDPNSGQQPQGSTSRTWRGNCRRVQASKAQQASRCARNYRRTVSRGSGRIIRRRPDSWSR